MVQLQVISVFILDNHLYMPKSKNGAKKVPKMLDREMVATLDDLDMRVSGVQGDVARVGLGIVGAKQHAVTRRKSKMLDKLEVYIDIVPDNVPNHSDIARYMRLIAEIDGTIKSVKEEKHLHIHKENIDTVNEEQLRKRLLELNEAKMSSEGVQAIDAELAV